MSRQDDFDRACAEFTFTMLAVADWQNRYYGASYSTRIAHAIDDARTAISRMEAAMIKDKEMRGAPITSGKLGT